MLSAYAGHSWETENQADPGIVRPMSLPSTQGDRGPLTRDGTDLAHRAGLRRRDLGPLATFGAEAQDASVSRPDHDGLDPGVVRFPEHTSPTRS